MPTLYFFVGYPGSGKTTVANYICESAHATHIWADRERQKLFGKPSHSQIESDELYGNLNDRVAQLLSEGHDVVFDTNFNYRKDRDHMRDIAAHAGADVQIIRMVTPKHVAQNRAQHGSHAERNGMHSIMTEETFQRIVDHLEPLGSDEPHIDIDGSDASSRSILQTLDLA